MYKKYLSWLLVFTLGAFVSLPMQGQGAVARPPGLIKVAKATGTVSATEVATGNRIELKNGSEISQGYVVNTGKDSSVVLVFSNGATINLAQDSSLSIDEFLQDPFAEDITVSSMTKEPSVSTTKLHLSRGELVGNVKKLNADAGSLFTVDTPVGAAGIRGTTFRIIFRPDGTGKAFFSLTTVEGNVVLTSGTVTVPEGISVTDNQEVVVDVNVDDATGVVTLTSGSGVITVIDTPPATQAEVAALVQQTVQAVATMVFTPTGTTTTTTPTQQGSEPPPPPAPTPRTTTGDGKTG